MEGVKAPLVSEQLREFPWAQLGVISLVRLSEPVAFMSLFPYMYFMVRDFDVSGNESQIATYSGWLGSAFALCQVVSSMNWGHFAEKYGRKWALILGQLGTCCSLLILGFAQNYYQALIARSLMGLLNGNAGVVRTVIGELATEDRHQAVAFSSMQLLWQFGSVLGPMLGGYLAFPEGQREIPKWFPSWLSRMVSKFPYSLPNLVIAVLLLTSVLATALFLQETHPHLKHSRDRGLEVGSWLATRVWPGTADKGSNAERVVLTDEEFQSDAEERTHLLHNGYRVAGKDYAYSQVTGKNCIPSGEVQTHANATSDAVCPVAEFAAEGFVPPQEETAVQHMLYADVFYPIVSNFFLELHLTSFVEFLPVFLSAALVTEERPDGTVALASRFPWKIVGGIGMTSDTAGNLLSTTGIVGCLVMFFLFPFITQRYDAVSIYRGGLLMFPAIYIIVPYIVFMQQDSIPKWWTYVYLYFLTSARTTICCLTMPQMLLIIHRTCHPSFRGVINSASISIGAAARFIGPLLCGYVMSWSQAHSVAWLMWWLLATISLIAGYQAYKIRAV
ncbi:AaceriAEL057Cp [[Ashbya] aceris (nom. inval.)]|nr:AaceriAEL057Cp [[Ashbya] aceris (nom. inval.)]